MSGLASNTSWVYRTLNWSMHLKKLNQKIAKVWYSMYSRMLIQWVCCCPFSTLYAHRRRILVPKSDRAFYLYYSVIERILLESEEGWKHTSDVSLHAPWHPLIYLGCLPQPDFFGRVGSTRMHRQVQKIITTFRALSLWPNLWDA